MSDFNTILEALKETILDENVKKKQIKVPKPSCENKTLIFLDIESTGLDLEKDRIIQLSFLKKTKNKVEVFNDLCYTDVEMDFTAMGIHHITPEMIEDKYWPHETDSYLALEKENIESNYFISHSNELDIAMLENEGMKFQMKCIDTDQCARHILKDAENYKLQTLRYQYGLYKYEKETAEKLGIDEIRAHDALGDALLHYLLFEYLLEKVEGNLDKLVLLTNTPVLLEKITFGKYKNKEMTFEELWARDPNDFVWMYTHTARRWVDLENTVEYWLKRNSELWNKAQEKRKNMAWFD